MHDQHLVRLTILAGLLLAGTTFAEEAASPSPLRLVLPPEIHAVVGLEANLYFDNVILTLDRSAWAFDVDCAIGTQQSERWTCTPSDKDVGKTPLTLTIRDAENRVVALGATVVRVSPASVGGGREVSLLVIGDSLTHASIYPARVFDLGKQLGPEIRLVGSHAPNAQRPEIRHEGYGGWTAERFATLCTDSARPGAGADRGSPFLFKDAPAAPQLDFARYFEEVNEGKAPDFVVLFLGCNDTFGVNDETIESRIDWMFGHYDALIAALKKTAPATEVGALLLVPPAASQDAFGANYTCGQTRVQYRRNQHRVVERMLAHYGDREAEGIFLIPAHVALDCEHNYPTQTATWNIHCQTQTDRQCNGVHPAAGGYNQIGDAVFAWLKGRL